MEYLRNSTPDIILLDLYIQGFMGWDLLHEIKNMHPYLPVLIVTAYDNYVDDSRLSQAAGYIIKNFGDFDRLKQKIAEL